MMTLTPAPETETRLRTVAEGEGIDLAELQDTLAGLDRSMADVAAGRWITSKELDRRLEARADAVRARINNAQSLDCTSVSLSRSTV